MDFNFKVKRIASSLTDEELTAAAKIFYEEQQDRQKIQHQKLIDNLYKAFSELREAGIVLKYTDPYVEEEVYLENWRCFEFV